MKNTTILRILSILILTHGDASAQTPCGNDTIPPTIFEMTAPVDPVEVGTKIIVNAHFIF